MYSHGGVGRREGVQAAGVVVITRNSARDQTAYNVHNGATGCVVYYAVDTTATTTATAAATTLNYIMYIRCK